MLKKTTESRAISWYQYIALKSLLALADYRTKAVVLLLLIRCSLLPLLLGFCVCSMFCCAVICVLSSFAIILMGLERADCFTLFVFLVYCDCKCSVAFLEVPWVALRCVIMVFPDLTHILFCE